MLRMLVTSQLVRNYFTTMTDASTTMDEMVGWCEIRPRCVVANLPSPHGTVDATKNHEYVWGVCARYPIDDYDRYVWKGHTHPDGIGLQNGNFNIAVPSIRHRPLIYTSHNQRVQPLNTPNGHVTLCR
jgi:hypothetical protein